MNKLLNKFLIKDVGNIVKDYLHLKCCYYRCHVETVIRGKFKGMRKGEFDSDESESDCSDSECPKNYNCMKKWRCSENGIFRRGDKVIVKSEYWQGNEMWMKLYHFPECYHDSGYDEYLSIPDKYWKGSYVYRLATYEDI